MGLKVTSMKQTKYELEICFDDGSKLTINSKDYGELNFYEDAC